MSGPGATPAEGESEVTINSSSEQIISTGFSPAPIPRNAMVGLAHGAYPACLRFFTPPLTCIIALKAWK
jgi:hypothetical protein